MKTKFCTILNALKSPQNVGMILRSHVAYGGSELIFTGIDHPWKFKKGSQAFSRKLENQCNILHIPDQYDVLGWCGENNYTSIAIEIAENTCFLDEFSFPNYSAIIVGNEEHGLDDKFMEKCDHTVTIKQIGRVGSLNVAVSASTAMYEFNRNTTRMNEIVGTEYQTRKI
ncbi:TrmH family RNA methyltransferase [Desulfobacula sp.]|uniref:TrmH family RNA methyltransferase n=1 Tax=Desulfobacula sp. TaxID=2593537 RepID=UPI002619E584|nr:TrmH family RNA methyltransferase [Desulfobacula sp.]